MSWQDDKPFLRQESCWRCAYGHSGETEGKIAGLIERVRCDITHRMGSIDRACYCDKFKPRFAAELYYGEDGIPIRNRTSLDYRTERQWNEVGRRLKDDAVGLDMHSTVMGRKTFRYYLIDETEKDPNPERFIYSL